MRIVEDYRIYRRHHCSRYFAAMLALDDLWDRLRRMVIGR